MHRVRQIEKMILLMALAVGVDAGTAFAAPSAEERNLAAVLHGRHGEWCGKLAWREADAIGDSRVSVGFECLDRELYDPERCYDPLAATGTKFARCQTGWFRCEREKGKYDFAWLDAIVDNHLKRGVKPWFNVGFGNPLYMTNCYSKAAVGHVPLYYGNECREAWCDYIRALARHFRGRVLHWEIWNESNNACFWVPQKPNAREYVRLIKLTAPIIRAEIPDAKVGACVSSVYEPYAGEFADCGGGNGLDFFAVHPYTTAPEHLMHWEAKMSYVDAIADLRRRFAAGGAPGIEIWNGEAGYNGWFPKKHWLYWNDEEIEDFDAPAKWLLRRFVLDRRAGCALSSYFVIADFTRPYEKSSTTWKKPPLGGLLDGETYRPRPAYFALGNYNALLADADWAPDAAFGVTCGDKRVRTMAVPLRRGDGQVCFAYWALTDTMRDAFGRRDDACLDLPEKFRLEDPVLVDLKTGDVWSVGSLRQLPLVDWPLVICERRAVRMAEGRFK